MLFDIIRNQSFLRLFRLIMLLAKKNTSGDGIKTILTYGTPIPSRETLDKAGLEQKDNFFYFCYLIRVEHKTILNKVSLNC